MKQSIKYCIIIFICAILMLFTSCQNNNEKYDYTVVTTGFSEYDWVRELIKGVEEKYNLVNLLDNGNSMHSYEPNVSDRVLIDKCDLFIYVGGESDVWVKDILINPTNKNQMSINLMDMLGNSVLEEEIIDGMQTEEESDDSDEIEYDEHVWLSIRNAKLFCTEICDNLITIDKENADIYQSNLKNYLDRLTTLDNSYQKVIQEAKQKTLLFADRFPFRYLAHDYSIEYFAAFNGCSAETEASAKTIAFLVNKVDDLNLKHICVLQSSDCKMAESIKRDSKSKDQDIIRFDSIENVKKSEFLNKSYYSLMEYNLNCLKDAFENV